MKAEERLLSGCLLWLWMTTAAVQAYLVPGCPGIYNITEDWVKNNGVVPKCFCDAAGETESGVRLNCVYANISDVIAASNLVKSASLPILQLHSSSLEAAEELGPDLFSDDVWQLRQIILRSCGDQELQFHPDALLSLRHTLIHIRISDCLMKRIPEAFRTLEQLRRLEVTSAELELVDASDFEGMTQLEHLDLSGNRLEEVEPFAFHLLDQLHTLILGPRNGFNQTIFTEVNRIKSLQRLEMAQLRLPAIPIGAFNNLTNLRHLNLLKNDFVNLSRGTFDGLESLEQLDLRVNLLKHLEPGVFQPLRSLKQLHLAGNYLTNVKAGVLDDLTQLEALDLAWNEFKTLEGQPFQKQTTLQELDLHHNLNLSFIDPKFFTGLRNLEVLNLSQTTMISLTPSLLNPLPELRRLDLSKNHHFRALDAKTFANNKRLTHLLINSTSISHLDEKVLEPLHSLEFLDMSENPWLCDDELSPLISRVRTLLFNAAEANRSFVIANGDETECAEPEELRGESLLTLDPDSLQPYHPPPSTTTQRPPTTTAAPSTTTTTTATLSPYYDNDNAPQDSRPAKGQSPTPKSEKAASSVPLIIGLVIAVLLSIFVIVVVVLIVRKKRRRREPVAAAEMTQKPMQSEAKLPNPACVVNGSSNL